MPPHKIRQEWLTLDEAAEVIRQHNITLLPAALIRHALHGDLSLSVYFPSPILLDHSILLAALPADSASRPFLLRSATNPATAK